MGKARLSVSACRVCGNKFYRLRTGHLSPHFDSKKNRHCPGGLLTDRPVSNAPGFKRIPGSRFAICGTCNEEHLLTSRGIMSIHDDSAGERCSGSSTKEQIFLAHSLKPKQTNSRKSGKQKSSVVPDSIWGEANSKRNLKGLKKPGTRTSTDRTIYVVNGAQIVHGGSPGLGKRR